ncbi:hypothetical protein G6F42_028274 [Rhizopus arrhizus]|nr:hypothetical protein G6F42_028274 [Rhizopus arrhizus]
MQLSRPIVPPLSTVLQINTIRLLNPKVLILDEATSALDSESEVLVQEALNRLMQGRTVFTIAHRLSTIRSADLVACLSDGGVAELGTYYELLSREDGVFRKLVELQSLAGPEDQQQEEFEETK